LGGGGVQGGGEGGGVESIRRKVMERGSAAAAPVG